MAVASSAAFVAGGAQAPPPPASATPPAGKPASAAGPAGKQESDQQATPEGQARFRAEANFVRVDVFPTVNGKPVADLAQTDFELLEDGVPQAIQTFEHVVVRGPGPEAFRREPTSVRESREMVEAVGRGSSSSSSTPTTSTTPVRIGCSARS